MKKHMKKLMTVIFIGGAVLASKSGFATGIIADDLYLGFQNEAGNATANYIINLGPASGIIGGSSVTNLTSAFSLANFKSVLGSSTSMYGGVVGGNQSFPTSDVYVTLLRSGLGVPSQANSSAPPTLGYSSINNGISKLNSLNGPAAGNGVLDTGLTWQTEVEDLPNPQDPNSFWGQTGINPDSLVDTNSVLYLDLYYETATTGGSTPPAVYEGYFTLDLTGGSPKLTFTPKNAPASLSAPTIQSVSKAGNTVTVISSNAVPNYTYQLQYTTSLSSPSWVDVGSAVMAGSTTVTNTDPSATDSHRFYQVMAQ